MQTGEVGAKVLRDVGLKDSLRRACCVARDCQARRDAARAFLLGASKVWALKDLRAPGYLTPAPRGPSHITKTEQRYGRS